MMCSIMVLVTATIIKNLQIIQFIKNEKNKWIAYIILLQILKTLNANQHSQVL